MTKLDKAHTEIVSRKPLDTDQFVLSPRAALYVAFLDAGNTSEDADLLADYSTAHPALLLEDCKPSVARAWKLTRI